MGLTRTGVNTDLVKCLSPKNDCKTVLMTVDVLPGRPAGFEGLGRSETPCNIEDFMKTLPTGWGYYYAPSGGSNAESECRPINPNEFAFVRRMHTDLLKWTANCKKCRVTLPAGVWFTCDHPMFPHKHPTSPVCLNNLGFLNFKRDGYTDCMHISGALLCKLTPGQPILCPGFQVDVPDCSCLDPEFPYQGWKVQVIIELQTLEWASSSSWLEGAERRTMPKRRNTETSSVGENSVQLISLASWNDRRGENLWDAPDGGIVSLIHTQVKDFCGEISHLPSRFLYGGSGCSPVKAFLQLFS